MTKSIDNKRPDKAATQTPRRTKRPSVRFEATVNNDHVDLRATAPTKWFRVLLRVLVIIVIAIVILKVPELWQAIQAAINLVPKSPGCTVNGRQSVTTMSELTLAFVLYSARLTFGDYLIVGDATMKSDALLWAFGLLVFLVVFLVAAWWFVLQPQYLAFKWGKASRNWPTVKGKITFAKLKEAGRHGHSAEIWYEYSVHEIEYASDRVALGVFLSTTLDDALHTYQRYKLGASVLVYYKPDDPKLAVLQPGMPGVRIRYGCLMTALVIIALAMTLAALIALVAAVLKML